MARFLPEAGLLFQHMPRTGGTWVERTIKVLGIRYSRVLKLHADWLPKKHCLANHYFRYKPSGFQLVASFVRHPLSYYESVWKWLKKNEGGPLTKSRWTWHPRVASARWYQPEFNDWVFLMLRREPMWYTRLVELYVGPEGGEFCDFIGRTETLAEDVRGILTAVGYGEQVRRRWNCVETDRRWNESGGRLAWNEGLKQDVLETERLMIDRFYGENFARRIYAGWRQKEIARVAEGGFDGSLGVLPRRSW